MKPNRVFLGGLAAIAFMFATVSCAPSPATPIPPPPASPTPRPTIATLAMPEPRNLSIRIDSVTITKDDGDNGQGGEVYLVLLAIRGSHASAKLILPGQGFFQARIGKTIQPGRFSLTVNNVDYSRNEKITFYILGLENDDEKAQDAAVIEFAVNAALDALMTELPVGGSVVAFLLNKLTGRALEWWQQETVLGEYSDTLAVCRRGNYDRVSSTNRHQSSTSM